MKIEVNKETDHVRMGAILKDEMSIALVIHNRKHSPRMKLSDFIDEAVTEKLKTFNK